MAASPTSESISVGPALQAAQEDRGAGRRGAGTAPAEISALLWLKALIKRKTDLWIFSERMNVNPSTVQKILKGHPVSRGVLKKIETAFQKSRLFDENGTDRSRPGSHRATVEKLMKVHHSYREEKSLRAVGEKLGLSPERVRQLLLKGTEIGLFKYRPSGRTFLSREKVLNDYRRLLALNQVAKTNRISTYRLSKLMSLHRITKAELWAIRLCEERRRCLKQYFAFAESLGHHPTLSELTASKTARPLTRKIRSRWKSLDAFREELNVRAGMPIGNEAASVLNR